MNITKTLKGGSRSTSKRANTLRKSRMASQKKFNKTPEGEQAYLARESAMSEYLLRMRLPNNSAERKAYKEKRLRNEAERQSLINNAARRRKMSGSRGPPPPPPSSRSRRSQDSNVDIQELEDASDLKTLKHIYRTLVKKYHPDIQGGNHEKFIKIDTKYKELLETFENMKNSYA